MASLLDPALEKTLSQDKQWLQTTKLPVVTVSASFKEDLKAFYGLPDDDTLPDVVFSRAHYSMAVAIMVAVWTRGQELDGPGRRNQLQPDPTQAWVVDPTNYVTQKEWRKIELTEFIGKTLARQPFLKAVKDLIDRFGRSKLPILESITAPLLYLTSGVSQPILSLHIAAGNILVAQGKDVVQVITDPHVREEYLLHAGSEHLWWCVFDQATKLELLEKAAILKKTVIANRVIVTGPPIDPRVVAARQRKRAWRSGPLQLCLTTGGLGTNKTEIKTILEQLIPELRKRPSPYRLLIYAGTQSDICDMVTHLAKKHHLAVHPHDDTTAPLRLLYHPQIVNANELLIKYGFPWADGFISKPSGDMAYDAAASGSFLLTLSEWGEWEHNVRERFEQLGISRAAQIEHIVEQLQILTTTTNRRESSWVEQAMNNAFSLDKLYLTGALKITQAYSEISEN